MARNPIIGGDRNAWGQVLNDKLDEVVVVMWGAEAITVTFAGATVTETPADGPIVTTTFNADGSITRVVGAPINQTITTTFGADGSITEAAT